MRPLATDLHHAIATRMRPFYHVPYAAFASNCMAYSYSSYVHGCLVGLLTILGALKKPFRGVSKIATDRLLWQCIDAFTIEV